MVNATPELIAALRALQRLDGPDFLAVARWTKGEGRSALRERGAHDEQIGPARFDVDLWEDAPFG